MNLLLTMGAMLASVAIGAAGGWTFRHAATRWCRLCGQPVGGTCIECRDRHRADNLRNARNQRHDMLTDAP